MVIQPVLLVGDVGQDAFALKVGFQTCQSRDGKFGNRLVLFCLPYFPLLNELCKLYLVVCKDSLCGMELGFAQCARFAENVDGINIDRRLKRPFKKARPGKLGRRALAQQRCD